MGYFTFPSRCEPLKRAPRLPRAFAEAAIALGVFSAVSGCEDLTVTAVETAAVEVSPAEGSLEPGGTLRLSATPRDIEGRRLDGRSVTWTSEDEAVATVSADGLATAHGPGTVRIVASIEGVQGAATLTVRGASEPDEPDDDGDDEGDEDDDGDDEDDGNGDDDGDEEDDDARASVAEIRYRTHGGSDDDLHLRVIVRVVDEEGDPVENASVSVRTTNEDADERWDLSGATDGEGTLELKINHHPSGCYRTEVRELSASGLTWDGTTPENRYCRD